ncbi:MAG: hypothetical protein LBV56_13395 [Delftia acidovorans]|nr:hypothetical protein [Delftia acidovorans]
MAADVTCERLTAIPLKVVTKLVRKGQKMPFYKPAKSRLVKGRKQRKLPADDIKNLKPSLLTLLGACMSIVGGLGRVLNFIDKIIEKIKDS